MRPHQGSVEGKETQPLLDNKRYYPRNKRCRKTLGNQNFDFKAITNSKSGWASQVPSTKTPNATSPAPCAKTRVAELFPVDFLDQRPKPGSPEKLGAAGEGTGMSSPLQSGDGTGPQSPLLPSAEVVSMRQGLLPPNSMSWWLAATRRLLGGAAPEVG